MQNHLLWVGYLLYRSMFLKIPVYLPTNDNFFITDAKSSRGLQQQEKIIKLFKTKPATKFLKEKFHLLVDNCNQFWTKRCYCVACPIQQILAVFQNLHLNFHKVKCKEVISALANKLKLRNKPTQSKAGRPKNELTESEKEWLKHFL